MQGYYGNRVTQAYNFGERSCIFREARLSFREANYTFEGTRLAFGEAGYT